MRFSTCRLGKTNGKSRTIFGIRNNVGKTYKHTNFGWDRFTGAPPQSGEISRFCDVCSPVYYINVKNYSSLKRGVDRPDRTYKTAEMIHQKYSH